MFGVPEGLLNGRQGFGPLGQLPMNDPRLARQPMPQQVQPDPRLQQQQILGQQQQQRNLFGPR